MKAEDDILAERVKAKLKNLEDGSDEPVPEGFTVNNLVHGEVVRRFRNEMSGTFQYDVSFTLNGEPIKTSVQLTHEEIIGAGQKQAVQALVGVLAEKIAGILIQKIMREYVQHELRRKF